MLQGVWLASKGGRRRVATVLLPLAILAVAVPAAGSRAVDREVPRPATGEAPERQPRWAADSVVVQFRAGLAARAQELAVEAHDAEVELRIAHTRYAVVSAEGEPAMLLADSLEQDGRFETVELNAVREASVHPNDLLYWKGGLRQRDYLDLIRMPAAWDLRRDAGNLKLAVLDTGVDLDHPDLRLASSGRDVISRPRDNDASDDRGHGTLVAGVAGARTQNSLGVSGAAWNASILPVKVLDRRGGGTAASVAEGIIWAVDNGASVINLSLGGLEDTSVERAAVEYALARDVVVVAAPGNQGWDLPEYPAAYPGVIAVGATDWSGNVAYFSNYGRYIDIAAPGVDVTSTALSSPGDELAAYSAGWGTSFAAPLVSGVALLLRAQHPTWTQAQVAARLKATARDVGPAGIDPYYGHGLLDAYAALGGPPAAPAVAPPGDGFEPNDVAERATPVALGTVRPTIAPQGDADWWVYDMAAPGWLNVSAAPHRADWERTEDFAPLVEVYDSKLALLNGAIGSPMNLEVPVRVPGRVYVKVVNALNSRTPAPYYLTVEPGPAKSLRFAPQQTHWPGTDVEDATVADLTGDGRKDVLVTAAFPHNALYLYRQLADGTLRPPDVHPTRFHRRQTVATGDFDDDGLTDAVVPGDKGVQIFHQRSGGGLAEPVYLPLGFDVSMVVAADVGRDGRDDLVLQHEIESGRLDTFVLTNTPGGFTEREVHSGSFELSVVGDANGDGRPDLVGVGRASGFPTVTHQIERLLQTSTGGFSVSATGGFGNGLRFDDIGLGDVTGDGRPDIVAVKTSNSGTLRVFAQDSGGGLMHPVTYPTYDLATPIEIADVDADGRNDVATAHGSWRSVGVFYQRPDGTLAPEELYDAPLTDFGADGLAVDDITGDGAVDIASAGEEAGLIVHGQLTDTWPPPGWVRAVEPADFASGVPATVRPTLTFVRALAPSSVSAGTVRLLDGTTGAGVAAAVTYDPGSRRVEVRPGAALQPGPYELHVRGVRDAAGVVMPSDTAFRFLVGSRTDSTLPDTAILSGPPPRGALFDVRRALSFGTFDFFATEPGGRFECSIDGAAFVSCYPPWEGAEREGAHTFAVRAVDASGLADPTPATWSWEITESIGPPANYESKSAQPVGGLTGSVDGTTLGAGHPFPHDPLSAFFSRRHAYDGGAAVWFKYTASRSGTITFDTAGSDFDTILRAYDRQPTLAAALVTSNDDTTSTVRTSRVSIIVARDQTIYVEVDGLNNGIYPANGRYELAWSFAAADTVAPVVSLTKPGSVAAVGGTVALEASATDNVSVSSVDFLVDGVVVATDASAPYTATWSSLSRPDGPVEIAARAVDHDGNEATAARRLAVDNTPPDTTIVSGPPELTQSRSAEIVFTSNEPGVSFECFLDTAEFAPCASPLRHDGLADGAHGVQVRAVDAAGNRDSSPSWWGWTVDGTGPTARPPQRYVLERKLGVANIPVTIGAVVEGSPRGVRVELERSLNGGPYSRVPVKAGVPAVGLALEPRARHRFRVRGIDAAGNVGEWAEGSTFTVTPRQEGAAGVTYRGRWTRLSAASAYGRALRHSSATGASARFRFVGDTIALVSTKGRGHGKAAIRINGVQVATVDLYVRRHAPRRIVFTRSWSTSAARTIEVRVLGRKNPLSRGKRVDVDAFVVLD